jgi:hypothetical protein
MINKESSVPIDPGRRIMKASHIPWIGFSVLLCSSTASLAFETTHDRDFKNFGQFVSSKAQSRNDARKDKHDVKKDRTGYKDFKNFGQFVSELARDRNQGSNGHQGGGSGNTNASDGFVSGGQGGQQGYGGNGNGKGNSGGNGNGGGNGNNGNDGGNGSGNGNANGNGGGSGTGGNGNGNGGGGNGGGNNR